MSLKARSSSFFFWPELEAVQTQNETPEKKQFIEMKFYDYLKVKNENIMLEPDDRSRRGSELRKEERTRASMNMRETDSQV